MPVYQLFQFLAIWKTALIFQSWQGKEFRKYHQQRPGPQSKNANVWLGAASWRNNTILDIDQCTARSNGGTTGYLPDQPPTSASDLRWQLAKKYDSPSSTVPLTSLRRELLRWLPYSLGRPRCSCLFCRWWRANWRRCWSTGWWCMSWKWGETMTWYAVKIWASHEWQWGAKKITPARDPKQCGG